MSRDPWLKQIRIAWATADARLIEEALTEAMPTDGLQHAGSALLRVERSNRLASITGLLTEALRDRNWLGDAELVRELEHHTAGTTLDLTPLPLPLEDLGEALNQQAGAESIVDVTTGMLWPQEILELGEGPSDFDSAPDRWLFVHGVGSRTGYAVMQRFVETVDQSVLAERLGDSLVGSGAFRRFQNELRRHEDEFTRWHRFRYDARLGQAREWLYRHGYRSTN